MDMNVGDVVEPKKPVDGAPIRRYRIVIRHRFHVMMEAWDEILLDPPDWESRGHRRRTMYLPISLEVLMKGWKVADHDPLTRADLQKHHVQLPTFFGRTTSWKWGDKRGLPYEQFLSSLQSAKVGFDPGEVLGVHRLALSVRGTQGGYVGSPEFIESRGDSLTGGFPMPTMLSAS